MRLAFLLFFSFLLYIDASSHLTLLNAWKGGSVVRNALKLLFEMLVGLICALVCAVYWA